VTTHCLFGIASTHGLARLTLLGVLVFAAPVTSAANGSLKVTSFPSGAEVLVDGTNTGRVTPMSVSLSEGEHIVTVRIPNSLWNPDTRTVTIVTGNNDLSVTLLPVLTAGPQGPPGAKGDKGDNGDKGDKGDTGSIGPQGEPGSLALAGQICPEGTFVVGFNVAGQVLCDGPGGPGPMPAPIVLPHGQLIEDYLISLNGTEANGSSPFQGEIQGITFQATMNLVGFAFCEPPNPLAPPSLTPPLYACAPEVDVTFVANSSSQATLTIDVGHIFVGLAGNWSYSSTLLPDDSGLIAGFALLTGVRMQFSVPLVDAGDGLKSFGPATAVGFTTQASNVEVDFGDSRVDFLAGTVEDFALPRIRNELGEAAQTALNTALAAIPPFEF